MAFHLAQMNVAVLKAPLDSPQLAEFVAALERINTLAEESPGFVWRLKDDDGDATALRPLGANTLINMSVWQDVASLRRYAYESEHVGYLRRRSEWFEQGGAPRLVMWWQSAGQIPTVDDGLSRLSQLRDRGPAQDAFTFSMLFPPPQ